MKKITLLTCISMMLCIFMNAQSKEYKIVFDMTSKDTVNQQSLIRQLGFIRESNANAKLEVVIYGQGMDMVTKGKANQESAVQQLIANKDISFKVCAIAMKRYNIDKTQLISGVEVVPDGIYEIFLKQQDGWGYIKVAH